MSDREYDEEQRDRMEKTVAHWTKMLMTLRGDEIMEARWRRNLKEAQALHAYWSGRCYGNTITGSRAR